MKNKRSNIGANAPEFPAGLIWLNSDELKMKDLEGKVVMIDFWTYSCVNCLRTLPHIKEWHRKYAKKGLVIIGVHTPEFDFEREPKNVKGAVEELGIDYPVVLDSGYAIWNLYTNHWWPRKLLVDHEGKIVYDHIGEGNYMETEAAIQKALRAAGAKSLPKIADTGVEGEGDGGVCLPVTPETYLGYERGRYANHDVEAHHPKRYRLPRKFKGAALSGEWKIEGEHAESLGGSLHISYKAAEVNLVMSYDKGDSEEVMVKRDGEEILHTEAGDDVSFGSEGSMVNVSDSRMYKIINGGSHHEGVLELECPKGVRVYAFTFKGEC